MKKAILAYLFLALGTLLLQLNSTSYAIAEVLSLDENTLKTMGIEDRKNILRKFYEIKVESSLPACEGVEWLNCQGTWHWATGKSAGMEYFGEYKNNKAHGKGKMRYPDFTIYVGEFKNGKRHGQGTYIYNNGEIYIGEYKRDKYHGLGTYLYDNGDKYVGEHKNDKEHGQGTYTFADGTVIKGIYKKGKLIKK
jgi:hypothetical protein|tara:strand:- start:64 stop:645 length:582 start_codon:yes stop_codon:yes gene_type:complete